MSLKETLSGDLKEAMKAGKEFETGVFRMIISALHNKEIEKKGKGAEPTLSDDEVLEVLAKEAKKRKEAADVFSGAGRSELAEKELKELDLIKKYLPEQLPAEEVDKIVKAAVEKTGAKTIKEFGKVMAEAMKDLKGKADASAVSEAAKKFLANE